MIDPGNQRAGQSTETSARPTLLISHIIIGAVSSDSRRDRLIRRLLEMRSVDSGASVRRGAQNSEKGCDSGEYITGLRGGQSEMPLSCRRPVPPSAGVHCTSISGEKEDPRRVQNRRPVNAHEQVVGHDSQPARQCLRPSCWPGLGNVQHAEAQERRSHPGPGFGQ